MNNTEILNDKLIGVGFDIVNSQESLQEVLLMVEEGVEFDKETLILINDIKEDMSKLFSIFQNIIIGI